MPYGVTAGKQCVDNIGGKDGDHKQHHLGGSITDKTGQYGNGQKVQRVIDDPAAGQQPLTSLETLQNTGRKDTETAGYVRNESQDTDIDNVNAVGHQEAGIKDTCGEPADDGSGHSGHHHTASPFGKIVPEIEQFEEIGSADFFDDSLHCCILAPVKQESVCFKKV